MFGPEIPGQDESDDLQRRYSAGHIYSLRILETEVHRVLYLQEDVDVVHTQGLKHWIKDVHNRLDAWLAGAETFSRHRMLEFRNVNHASIVARLYRPAPRLQVRTTQERQICLDICQTLVESYQHQVKTKTLYYPWHGAHILFDAAVIMLDACWSVRDVDSMRRQARYTLSISIPDCLNLLARIGETWDGAALCSEYLQRAVDDVSKAFNERLLGNTATDYHKKEENISQTIQELLFPEGPISWEHRRPEAVSNSATEYDMQGLESFDWETIWNLSADFPSMLDT